MRLLMLAGAIALLLLPAAAKACNSAQHMAQAGTTEYSAQKKPMKKTAKKKMKKEKVEYMRAAPMK